MLAAEHPHLVAISLTTRRLSAVGVRYKTPVGPVRGDISYNFSPTRYPVRDQNKVDTLSHWNFFFSIGQTF